MTTHLAYLGATGHISAGALADLYATREGFQLALFSRRPHETAAAYHGLSNVSHHDIATLSPICARMLILPSMPSVSAILPTFRPAPAKSTN